MVKRTIGRIPAATFTLALLALPMLPASGSAQQRADTLSMNCAEIQSLMKRQGAAVLNTGPTTYDRYVRDMSFCNPGDVTKPSWVPARDTKQCFVGNICWDPSLDSGRR
ncbi:MAG: hypothetical protein B7Z15_10670 [Rhizobiales bacterium 32-66-8]|nr:MAG: hypothetical protein B7Z15_10670 [Rhizobiales bacterium 32-66-8]